MAKFNRKVERQKTEYTFTKKEVIKETNFTLFKENFSFSWIPKKWSSLLVIALVFVIVSFSVIPFIMQSYSQAVSMLVGHGIITSLLIIITFYLIDTSTIKPSLKVLAIRYLFLAMLLSTFAVISIMVL